MISKLDKWHKTKLGRLAFALVELILTYIFVSMAIDKGSLWYYLLTLIFLVGTLQNLTRLIGSIINAKQTRRS